MNNDSDSGRWLGIRVPRNINHLPSNSSDSPEIAASHRGLGIARMCPFFIHWKPVVLHLLNTEFSIQTRVGHAYAEYANDADYAHMRNMRMRMRIENLIHIIHI